MIVFVVHGSYHYDDYKKGESHSIVEGIFRNKSDAFDLVIKKFHSMFDIYAKYNFDEWDDCCHNIDIEFYKDCGVCKCEYCGKLLTSEGNLDLSETTNQFTREHIYNILFDNKISNEQKYDFIHENLYDILPKAEFSLTPTHIRYFVEEMKLQ